MSMQHISEPLDRLTAVDEALPTRIVARQRIQSLSGMIPEGSVFMRNPRYPMFWECSALSLACTVGRVRLGLEQGEFETIQQEVA